MLRHPANGSQGIHALVRRALFRVGRCGLARWGLARWGLARWGLARCGLALWLLGLFLSQPAQAQAPAQAQTPAPSKASCAEAYESAQESRASGALQETRSRLAHCAQTECPSFVQKDCARWLEEVDRELPSVVVSVVGLQPDAVQTTSLKIDGRAISDPLSGKIISLDPGKHELVLERAGAEPLTRTILAQQGVQNRNVEIRLADAAAPAQAESTFAADTAAPRASPLRTIAYASWGVGAVGIGAFAVLGTLARADKKAFEEQCQGVTSIPERVGPGVCHEDTADQLESKYQREEVLADVGLITGIVGAATGTVLFVLSMNRSSTAKADPSATASARLHLDVAPTAGGAWASVSGAF
jgi:hypothetical protein